MNKFEARVNNLEENKEKRAIKKEENKEKEKILDQNINDIEKFYKFLGHNSKTNFQVFFGHDTR